MTKEEQTVRVGGMSESGYGIATLEHFRNEKLGNYTVLFVGPWTPEKLHEIGQFCRKENMRFVMDEMVNRLTGEITKGYAPIRTEVLKTLSEYADVCDGSLLMCEYGGLMFYWPWSTVAESRTLPPPAADSEEAARNTEQRMREAIACARASGLKAPFICIEACGVAASFLYRAGIDRVDLEVIYTAELERGYAAVKGASLAFGKPHFGVDMAMVWYGGSQHDELWAKRWRTSLFHAFLRGADPIYAEHGVMDYKALGKHYGTDHPQVRRFRSILAEVADYASKHPRPAGFPESALGVVQGRFDGFTGAGQTHLWGQRKNEAFRLGAPDRSWELFERLYRRRSWENREKYGDADFSGNPPLGQADIIPFDAPDELFFRYKALIFLGRNSMDDTLYRKLIRFVQNGGQLLMCAAHLNASALPSGAYEPFRNGDWSELFGVRLAGADGWTLPCGIKFKAEPSCGWRFPLWSPNCDPKYTDGGFPLGELENTDAEVLAVASDRFVDGKWSDAMRGVLYAKTLGRGCAVLVNSLDYPGADGLKNLYGFLMDSCCEANQDYPKVECSDRVRFATYAHPEGRVLYFLNTEERLSQDVILHAAPGQEEAFTLAPGEILEKRLPGTAPHAPEAARCGRLAGS